MKIQHHTAVPTQACLVTQSSICLSSTVQAKLLESSQGVTTASQMAAAPSTPKPSSAPVPSVPMPASPPVSYSPAVTPDVTPLPNSPQEVNSSSDSDSRSEMSEYNGHTVLTQLQTLAASGEMSPAESSQFWGDCDDVKVHEMMCPQWIEMLKRHSQIHLGSLMPSTERQNKTLRWYHSTPVAMSEMLSQGKAGQRFLFSSPAACGLDRMVHSHYRLSHATVSDGFWIIGCFIHEAFLIDAAKGCQNGYSASESVSIPCVTQAGNSIVGLISVAPSIGLELKTDATLQLMSQATRGSC
eukprot:4013022-Amphidinium_carterae.1